MLVLALQFSRCDWTHRGARVSSTRAASTRSAGSFKTEEKNESVGAHHEGGETYDLEAVVDEPTSAPTGSLQSASWRKPRPAARLLRKEVIQPHLPVRLPCYDFTPITDPTFDGSLPNGLGHRLRVLPTFVV